MLGAHSVVASAGAEKARAENVGRTYLLTSNERDSDTAVASAPIVATACEREKRRGPHGRKPFRRLIRPSFLLGFAPEGCGAGSAHHPCPEGRCVGEGERVLSDALPGRNGLCTSNGESRGILDIDVNLRAGGGETS